MLIRLPTTLSPRRSTSSVRSVAPVLLGVSASPVGTGRGTGLGGHVALLVETTGLLAGSGETSLFSVSLLGGADPVDAGISSNGLVVGVTHNAFEELVGGILTNPVGGEDTEVGATTADTLFSDVLVGLLLLELTDTVVDGLTVNATLAGVSFVATTADSAAVDNVTLLGLVSQSAGLIGTG